MTNRELARQRDDARMREQQAVFQRGRAEAVTDFLVGLFRSTAPEQTRGHDVGARELVDKARAGVEAGLAAQPDLKASMLSALSDVYLAFDDLDTAERLARAAASLRDSTSTDPTQRAAALLQTAVVANRRGRPADALKMLDAVDRLVHAPDPGMRSRTLETRAETLLALARTKEAVPLLEEDVDVVTTAYGEDDPRALRATTKLAGVLRAAGRVDDAQALLALSLPRMRRNLAPDDPYLAESLIALAMHARNHGDMDQAEPLAKEALELDQRIYGENSAHTSRTAQVLATIESARGRKDEARALFARSLAIVVAIYGGDSAQAASAEFNLGSHLQASGAQVDEALAHLQRAVAIATQRLPPDHINLAIYRISLGSSLRERGRHTEADAVLRQALAVFEANPAPRGLNIALTRGELACNELGPARSAEAIAALQGAVIALHRIAPDEPSVLRLDRCLAQATSRRR
ncbi:tetratricopeptide repeat protein [Dokdonella sp.]|uniref:tetratricopeptide repeat protein n=1 Tax=Dokdonella sp. TaxID=2291710 RepID=UPI002F41C891